MRSLYIKHDRVQFKTSGPSLTKQSFKDECNINNIMAKFQKTGALEHLNEYDGQYGNFVGVEDYHASANKIIAANEMFASLPSTIRNKFRNNPAEFLAFAQNPANADELVEMGLARKKKEIPTPLPEGDPIPIPTVPPTE